MNNPSGDVLEAFKRVGARPEGQVILGFLVQQRDMTYARLAHEADAVVLRTLQGEAQSLTALIQALKP